MKKLIVITDWAKDNIYSQEFQISVDGYIKDSLIPNINFISATTSSINSGFLLEQIVRTEERLGRPGNTVFFIGSEMKDGNQRSFYILRLKSGAIVCGENYQYNFTFIKPKIDEAFSYSLELSMTNFTSRDYYARIIAHLLESMEDDLELDEVHTNTILETSGFYVGHIDSFGNIITTINESKLKGKYEYGDNLEIEINRQRSKVVFVKNIYQKIDHSSKIGPGSFGLFDDSYLELPSAKTQFDEIKSGDLIDIKI
ncbi:hypothetical protein A3C23_03950 [Candidatus Roizmanbacteria bacterium RIFCSPHIGHO2_02_FULL_37_13b]|uniref:S-adenosyl-l-methionine hydroxide adenosyltransferase C-terminal domain-containing protein n=1 Tax=Candidatus Roizmanbacteria bacterium RIFCSPLOWO2_02_FULL_36_11 TaxID=1802071 RepID=A0A1F7JC08_9BACT|nr:MAG: hypothetical protein A3C23_03950 [Candidatus Roizmanbacteria bacterium RIFCSPHIGHO2_02_FULL_37_13b]OGK53158.1 MAG: hypothetical protein A3H78_02145 [Candidatus Roizmanbacteria bacterium RIFCSPLOWO2_02_FULL_36_11]